MNYILSLSLTNLIASLGYLLAVGVIKPYLAYHKTRSEIGIELNYYSNIITSPGVAKDKLIEEAEQSIRRLAMRLEADYLGIQFRDVLVKLKQAPPKSDLLSAKRSMVFISSSLWRGNSHENLVELGNVFAKLRITEVDDDNGIVKSAEIYQERISS